MAGELLHATTLFTQALAGDVGADDRLEALAYGGDRAAQRVAILGLQWGWERGLIGDLEYTSKAIPFARLASEYDARAKNHLAGLLHVRGVALLETGDPDLASMGEDAHAEALALLDELADAGDEEAGAALVALMDDTPADSAVFASLDRMAVPVAPRERLAERATMTAAARFICDATGLDFEPVWWALCDRSADVWDLLATPEGWAVLASTAGNIVSGESPSPPTQH